MSDDPTKPEAPAEAPVDVSTEMLQRVARELGSPALDARFAQSPTMPYEQVSPMTEAFNRLGDRHFELPTKVPFMGTSPVSYVTGRDKDGNVMLDGKRGIEYQVPDSDFRLLAGSYVPGSRNTGVEHWTAAVAWTPVNLGGLKMGPMLGDVAQSNMRESEFERVGMSVGLYATAENKEGGFFAKVETDPAEGNKLKAFVGFKMPFNGQ